MAKKQVKAIPKSHKAASANDKNNEQEHSGDDDKNNESPNPPSDNEMAKYVSKAISRSQNQNRATTPTSKDEKEPSEVPSPNDNDEESSNKSEQDTEPEPEPKRKRRTIVRLTAEDIQERKRTAFQTEVNRIEREGILFDRCNHCEKGYRDCKIVMEFKDRQRVFHCLECFRRAKRCSHNEPNSAFRSQMQILREERDVEKGNKAAILRRQEEDREREEKRELKAEARRQEALRLKREELAVRTDEATTKREVVRGQLLLQERMLANPMANPITQPPVQNAQTDQDDNLDLHKHGKNPNVEIEEVD